MRASDQLRAYRGAAIPNGERPPRVAPFASDFLYANYADQEIVLAGTDVYTWGDLGTVGARTFTQADTSKDPLYGTFGVNPALVFNGTNTFMVSPVVTLSPYASLTFAMTFRFAGGATRFIYEVSANAQNIANIGAFEMYERNATTIDMDVKLASGLYASYAITGLVAGTVYRLIFNLNAAPAPFAYTNIHVNGVNRGNSLTGMDAPFCDRVHYLGARFGGTTSFWAGRMGDNFILGRALSAPEIVTLDAWMASEAS